MAQRSKYFVLFDQVKPHSASFEKKTLKKNSTESFEKLQYSWKEAFSLPGQFLVLYFPPFILQNCLFSN